MLCSYDRHVIRHTERTTANAFFFNSETMNSLLAAIWLFTALQHFLLAEWQTTHNTERKEHFFSDNAITLHDTIISSTVSLVFTTHFIYNSFRHVLLDVSYLDRYCMGTAINVAIFE
uniref:Uncharacterized protein n=1 Tax=Glossina austeni TaxID=7395 RepID=A0A1A9V9E6_GLOAU